MQNKTVWASRAFLLCALAAVIHGKYCKQKQKEYSDLAYHLELTKLDVWRAAQHCQSLDTQLASIDSAEELIAIEQYLEQYGNLGIGDSVWLSDFNSKSGKWISLSNTKTMSYFKQLQDIPADRNIQQMCLGMKLQPDGWILQDFSCSSQHAYLCEGSWNTPKESYVQYLLKMATYIIIPIFECIYDLASWCECYSHQGQ